MAYGGQNFEIMDKIGMGYVLWQFMGYAPCTGSRTAKPMGCDGLWGVTGMACHGFDCSSM